MSDRPFSVVAILRNEAPESRRGADIGQHGVLARVQFNMLAVRREPIAEGYIAHPLALTTFVLECIARRSSIASRSHWLTDAMMFITKRPAAELLSKLSPQALEQLQFAQVLHTPRQPVQLGNEDRLHGPAPPNQVSPTTGCKRDHSNVDAGIIHERDACFLGPLKGRKSSDGSMRVLRLLPEKVGQYVVKGVDRQRPIWIADHAIPCY